MRTAAQVYERADMTEANSAYLIASGRALAIKQGLRVSDVTLRNRSEPAKFRAAIKIKNKI